MPVVVCSEASRIRAVVCWKGEAANVAAGMAGAPGPSGTFAKCVAIEASAAAAPVPATEVVPLRATYDAGALSPRNELMEQHVERREGTGRSMGLAASSCGDRGDRGSKNTVDLGGKVREKVKGKRKLSQTQSSRSFQTRAGAPAIPVYSPFPEPIRHTVCYSSRNESNRRSISQYPTGPGRSFGGIDAGAVELGRAGRVVLSSKMRWGFKVRGNSCRVCRVLAGHVPDLTSQAWALLWPELLTPLQLPSSEPQRHSGPPAASLKGSFVLFSQTRISRSTQNCSTPDPGRTWPPRAQIESKSN